MGGGVHFHHHTFGDAISDSEEPGEKGSKQDIGSPDPPKSANILHLSDLHFGASRDPDPADDAKRWYGQLADDLIEELSCERLDGLILSGDIGNFSTPEEYDGAELFLEKLIEKFRLQAGQVVAVPGNHDLNQEVSEDSYKLVRRKNIPEDLKPDCFYEEGENVIALRDDDSYNQRFQHFRKFYEIVTGIPYPADPKTQITLHHLPAINLVIVGFNSCWEVDHHFTKRVSINPDALAYALDCLREKTAFRDCLKFAVWHHPLESPDEDRIKNHGFMQRLALSGFSVCLHGHIHKADARLYQYDMNPGDRQIHIIAAGTFGVPSREWTDGYPLQYNLLRLDGNLLRVETRRRIEKNGAWEADHLWRQGKGKPNLSYYDIKLNESEGALKSSSSERPRRKIPDPALEDGPQVEILRLPPCKHTLINRKSKLDKLINAWRSSTINAVVLVGPGGFGKSALVHAWLNKMASLSLDGKKEWGGAKRVFAWSFSGQGSRNQAVSVDEFIDCALTFFADSFATSSIPTGTSKIDRLTTLIRQTASILILDGLEATQEVVDGAETAPIKDPNIRKLVFDLATKDNQGLCVITTQRVIEKLVPFSSVVRVMKVGRLNSEEALALLRNLGVRGSRARLLKAADQYRYHPLSLRLLAKHLKCYYSGSIEAIDELPGVLETPSADQARDHASSLLMAIQDRQREKPTLSVLYLLSLFDRPAEWGALDVLRKEPCIPGLTERLVGMANREWSYLFTQLEEETGLIERLNSTVYVHPLIREFFRNEFQQHFPRAYQQANERLFDHFRNCTKQMPDTLGELELLCRSVSFGCYSGLHIKAFSEVYWPRISRKEKDHCARYFGAFSTELSALGGFFVEKWTRVVPNLPEDTEALVMSRVGSALRGIGRFQDAILPMQRAIALGRNLEQWGNAAKGAGDLCGLLQTLNRFDEALEWAQESVAYGERANDLYYQVNGTSRIATVYHRKGQLDLAQAKFMAAEELLRQQSSADAMLSSLAGVRYCDFLIDMGQTDEVHRRWNVLKKKDLSESMLDKPLFQLVLARDALAVNDIGGAEHLLCEAERTLRAVDITELLAQCVLLKARVALSQGDPKKGGECLKESGQMIQNFGLLSLESEQHLLVAEKWLLGGNLKQARAALKKISHEVTAYHRCKDIYRELMRAAKLKGAASPTDIRGFNNG